MSNMCKRMQTFVKKLCVVRFISVFTRDGILLSDFYNSNDVFRCTRRNVTRDFLSIHLKFVGGTPKKSCDPHHSDLFFLE